MKSKESFPFFTPSPLGNGYFGDFGGRYSPEILIPALDELEESYRKFQNDKGFQEELHHLWREYAGRPSLLTKAPRLSEAWGAEIWLKREDLNHTGSHKINNALGQALLARRMNKKHLIAETGAGQHGVATATAAAHLGFSCSIYMGEEDIRRQELNCFRIKLLGATLCPVSSGTATLKDATNEAMRAWAASSKDTHYVIGSVIGPHPFPSIVRNFQSIIGVESKRQFLEKTGTFPDAVLACVGGGSNAAGIFYAFLNEQKKTRLIGIEAGGESDIQGRNAASISFGKIGYFHGTRSLYIQDSFGQIEKVHSISAGLDYPGVGPEHAHWASTGVAEYYRVSDQNALECFQEVSRLEGIIPALESSHSFSFAKELAQDYRKTHKRKGRFLICLSGRGDKDSAEVQRILRDG